MRISSLAIAMLLSSLAAAALWFVADRPVEVPESWSQPMRSVSFAPFRKGQSPLTKVYPSPQQVEEDVASLVGMAQGLRTYTSREGMEVVPGFAAKYGLKMTQGAWLGSEVEAKGKAINEAEIAALIKAANEHPDQIERVIVGNEVLLRHDLKPEELIAYIRRVKAAVKQPVSYADVWAFYLKYPEVAQEVDYITIHILPFWEDEPGDIDHVEDHIVRIVERIRQAFPGKPILIGEAGWPSIGRDRGPAVVNTVNEARFVRKMAMVAAKYDFDYNIVEAFDQPWKSALENTVGAAWGVLDIDRRPKFAMQGPVTEVLDWKLRAVIAILAGAFATLALGLRIEGALRQLAFAFIAQLLAWLAVTTCFHAEAVAFRWWLELWAPLRGGLAVAVASASLRRIADLLAGKEDSSLGWTGQALLLVSGVYAFGWTVLLAFDGRYRDIPEIDFSVPCAALLLLALVRLVTKGATPWRAAISSAGLFGDGVVPESWRRAGRYAMAGVLIFAALTALQMQVEILWRDTFPRADGFAFGKMPELLGVLVSHHQILLLLAFTLVLSLPLLGRRRLESCLAIALPLASAAAVVSEGFAIWGEDFAKDYPTLGEQIPLVIKAMGSNREMLLWAAMLLVLALPFRGTRLGVETVVGEAEAAE
jgi:exo-beta-1,3-glucanase (GH17 family)